MRLLNAAMAIAWLTGWTAAAHAAQTPPAPTDTPATAPAAATTQPAFPPRHQMVMPPGFQRVTVGHREAICEPADEAWVRQTLTSTAPATRPTTIPSDVIQHLRDRRDLLRARVAGDLSLNDTSVIDKLIDETLIPQARKLEELTPPIFYLVTTHARLKEILKGGWSDPRFYYNRAADDVAYERDLRLADDRPMDDMLTPVIYGDNATPDEKHTLLSTVVNQNESSVSDAFSRRAMIITQLSLIDFIHRQAVEPLKLTEDQAWLGLGIEAVLSAKYMQDLVGLSYDDLLSRMTYESPMNPIRAASVDLLHPTDPNSMRPEWVPIYREAFRNKSATVVRDWVAKSGESAISVTLAAMRASPPADGAALLKLISVTTGADLTNEVKPR